jgi:hypothetical protein
MSYTEYLRRKAAAAPVVVDTRLKLDASSYTNRVRLAASADFAANGQKYGSVTNVNDPDSGGNNGNSIHAVASYKKGSGGRVPDASSFTAFSGSKALANQALVPTPVRLVKNSNTAGSISGCAPILAPIPYVPGGVFLQNVTTTLTKIDADNTDPGQDRLRLGGIHCYYNPVAFSTTIPTKGLVPGTTVTIGGGNDITLEVTSFDAMSANLQVVHVTSLGPTGALQNGTMVRFSNATDTGNNGTFEVSAKGNDPTNYTITINNQNGVARSEAKTATISSKSINMTILSFEASSGNSQVVHVVDLKGTTVGDVVLIINASDAVNNGTFAVSAINGPFTSNNTTYYTFTWGNASGVARIESKQASFQTPNKGTFTIFEVIQGSDVENGNPGFVFANPTAPGASFYTDTNPSTNTLSFPIYSSGTFAPNMVPLTGSQQAKNIIQCHQSKGEQHTTNSTTYPGPSVFVDNTITHVKNYNLPQNKTKYQIAPKCTACGGNPTGTGVQCALCFDSVIHAPPANMPHNTRWGPRPIKSAQPIIVVPSPSDARKVGNFTPHHPPFVGKHRGNPMVGHVQYPKTPYQIPAGTAAHVKINEPVHYPGTM